MRIDISALAVMIVIACSGGIRTNVVDGIVWLYKIEDSCGVICGAQLVNDREKSKCRRVCIPPEFEQLKTRRIGPEALEGLSWIGELCIPEEIQVVGSSAFADCGGLTNVTMAGTGRFGVGAIMDHAFSGCTNLERVVFAERLDRIERGAFSGCSKLKDAELPPWLRVLEGYAFDGCESLEYVRMPGIQIIGENPFAGCSHLRSLEIVPDNEYYAVDSQGVLKSKDGKLLISYPMIRADDTVVVPRGVVAIGGGAMRFVRLRRAGLPSSLRIIDTGAFSKSCLEEVIIPDRVVSVGACAFSGSALRRAVVGKDVEAVY